MGGGRVKGGGGEEQWERGESKNTTLKAIGPLVERETFKKTARATLVAVLPAQRFSAVPEETNDAQRQGVMRMKR